MGVVNQITVEVFLMDKPQPKPKPKKARLLVRPRESSVSCVPAVKPKKKFEDQHVRWTGYLTVENNRQLRNLLASGQIPSLTRFINEAVAAHLEQVFDLPQESAE